MNIAPWRAPHVSDDEVAERGWISVEFQRDARRAMTSWVAIRAGGLMAVMDVRDADIEDNPHATAADWLDRLAEIPFRRWPR